MKRSWSFSEGHHQPGFGDQRRVLSAALLQQISSLNAQPHPPPPPPAPHPSHGAAANNPNISANGNGSFNPNLQPQHLLHHHQLHLQHQQQQQQASLSLASSDAGCASPEQHASASGGANGWKDSPSESASSRETWPKDGAARGDKDPDASRDDEGLGLEQAVVHRVANMDRIQLRDVALEAVDMVAERMRNQPEEYLLVLKAELRDLLSGVGGSRQREQFSLLKNLLHCRTDLSHDSLLRANRTQLEILVAIKTGIRAFLHPEISLTQSVLIDIFFNIRCRNVACLNQLPVDDCICEACASKNGFCKACMCVTCRKFDFDVNTCRWIGCDSCSHWTHTDCAIRAGQICMSPSQQKRKIPASEMMFKCRACGSTSKLLGWVKDVFKACAADWNKDILMRELDCVRRIFRGCEEECGQRLFWKCEDLLLKLQNGADFGASFKELERFFQDMEVNTGEDMESDDAKIIGPREACNRISEVVQEAMNKMDLVYEEKLLDAKRARLALQMCDRELDDKRRELGELQLEKQKKTQQIDELQTIVKLKQAEAEMFQNRADEAQREAENYQRMAQATSEKAEEDYASRYLKLRLYEAEAERRTLFEKIKLQEFSRMQNDSSEMLSMCKIQHLLNQASNFSKNAGPSHSTPTAPSS